MDIGPVRAEEFEAAGAVTAEAYREFVSSPDDWNGYLRRVADMAGRADRTVVLVAREGGNILGTVTLEVEDRVPGGHDRPPLGPGQAHVRMLGVHPSARGRGVGRALMDACVAWARDAGKHRLTLDTTEEMTVAQHLYVSMGFERQPDIEFEDGWRLRWYELAL